MYTAQLSPGALGPLESMERLFYRCHAIAYFVRRMINAEGPSQNAKFL